MKFTLDWLKDHLETEATAEKIGEALTMIGLEVEEIVDPAAKLRPFVVAFAPKQDRREKGRPRKERPACCACGCHGSDDRCTPRLADQLLRYAGGSRDGGGTAFRPGETRGQRSKAARGEAAKGRVAGKTSDEQSKEPCTRRAQATGSTPATFVNVNRASRPTHSRSAAKFPAAYTIFPPTSVMTDSILRIIWSGTVR